MHELKTCGTCGQTKHLPLTEREVDKVRYCVIYIRRWVCTQCLEESIDEREYMKEEQV